MEKRARLAVLGASIGVALLFATRYAAFHIGFFERADQKIFAGFGGIGAHPHVWVLARFLAGLCNPSPYVYLAALPVVIALVRRRVPLAVTIIGILLGANVTTELMKPLLAQARPHGLLIGQFSLSPASWPSGHATAAMALALCLVLAVPARMRPFAAALGAVFTVAVVYSFLALGWHYPSDVLGGFLVATTWALLGVAALFVVQGRTGRAQLVSTSERVSVADAFAPPVLTLLGALFLVVVAVVARPRSIASYVSTHETFVVGAAGIGALALSLATGLMVALVRRVP